MTVDLDAAGEFWVYNKSGSVNVLIDVVGIYDDHTRADNTNRPGVIVGLRSEGSIQSGGDGVESVTYNATLKRYEISFTDFGFSIEDDVAQVTARSSVLIAGYTSLQDQLRVSLRATTATPSLARSASSSGTSNERLRPCSRIPEVP